MIYMFISEPTIIVANLDNCNHVNFSDSSLLTYIFLRSLILRKKGYVGVY